MKRRERGDRTVYPFGLVGQIRLCIKRDVAQTPSEQKPSSFPRTALGIRQRHLVDEQQSLKYPSKNWWQYKRLKQPISPN